MSHYKVQCPTLIANEEGPVKGNSWKKWESRNIFFVYEVTQ